jgi:N-acetylmuramoyl-L-alanine amidase
MMLNEFFDGLRVCHDPGHAEENEGCRVGDMWEKTWTLAMARDVGETLKPWGVRQMFTRQADIAVSHGRRARIAHEFGAHLSILYHANWIEDNPEAHGLITFCWTGRPRALECARQGMRCAPAELQRRHHEPAQPGGIHWTRGADTVLRPYERLGLNAVLVEFGFASNARDLEILNDASHRPSLVLTVCSMVTRMLELQALGCEPLPG